MSSRIPPAIKSKVIQLWLKGISRDAIARSLKIEKTSVSRILDSSKSTDIPDLDLLRQVALKMKTEGFELAELASGIRLSNFIKQMGLTEERMEELLRDMEIYCFQNDLKFHDLATIIDKIKDFELNFDITIEQIPDYLEKKKQELYKLANDRMTLSLDSRYMASGRQI